MGLNTQTPREQVFLTQCMLLVVSSRLTSRLRPSLLVLLAAVFASQFTDYATDFGVAWGLCSHVPGISLPHGPRGCAWQGHTDCGRYIAFCTAFAGSSLLDLAINLVLELGAALVPDPCAAAVSRVCLAA